MADIYYWFKEGYCGQHNINNEIASVPREPLVSSGFQSHAICIKKKGNVGLTVKSLEQVQQFIHLLGIVLEFDCFLKQQTIIAINKYMFFSIDYLPQEPKSIVMVYVSRQRPIKINDVGFT